MNGKETDLLIRKESVQRPGGGAFEGLLDRLDRSVGAVHSRRNAAWQPERHVGNVTMNVVPSPSALSTASVPPCLFTMS